MLFWVGLFIPVFGAAAPLPVELYVMSLCPFGVQAENALLPAAQALGGAVDLQIHFIATEVAGSTVPTFRALHGPPEVEENIRQLCALRLFPEKAHAYILARNKDYRSPDWRPAASTAAIDAQRLESCVSGAEGKLFLKEDLPHHQEKSVRGSPTIFIDGRLHQGPRGRKALTVALCDALTARGDALPAACAEADSLPPDALAAPAGGCAAENGQPLSVGITAVVDPDCALCGPALLEPLKRRYPKGDIKILTHRSREGRRLIKAAGTKALPLYFFDRGVEKDPDFIAMKDSFLVPTGDFYWITPGARTYAPSVRTDRKRRAGRATLFLTPGDWAGTERLLSISTGTESSNIHFQFSVFPGEGPDARLEAARLACLLLTAGPEKTLAYAKCRRGSADCPVDDVAMRCMAKKKGELLVDRSMREIRELESSRTAFFFWENRFGPFSPANLADLAHTNSSRKKPSSE